MKSFKVTVSGKERTIRFNDTRMKFEYTMPYKDINGKYKNKTIRANSIDELQNKIVDYENNTYDPDNKNMIFRTYIKYYLDNVCATVNRRTTIRIKRSILNQLPNEILDQK